MLNLKMKRRLPSTSVGSDRPARRDMRLQARVLVRIMVLTFTPAVRASGQDAPPSGATLRFASLLSDPALGMAQDQPGGVPIAVAEDTALDDAATPEWRFMLAPYFWLPAQSGHTKVKGITSDVSLTLPESWDLLDENFSAAILLHFEASKEQFTLFTDVMYLDLDHTGNGLFGTRDIGLEQGIFELGAAYAVIDRPLVEGQELGWRLEPLAGARVNYLESSADFPILIDFDDDKAWVDGFIGARTRLQLDSTWTLFARGDIGAGGSDFVWNALAGAEVRLASWASLMAGYRALSTDYSDGDFEYDMVLYGPFIALAFYF